jgi:hypothetical protein
MFGRHGDCPHLPDTDQMGSFNMISWDYTCVSWQIRSLYSYFVPGTLFYYRKSTYGSSATTMT